MLEDDLVSEVSIGDNSYTTAYSYIFNNFHMHFLLNGYRKDRDMDERIISPSNYTYSALACSQTWGQFYAILDAVALEVTGKNKNTLHDEIIRINDIEWIGPEADAFANYQRQIFNRETVKKMSDDEMVKTIERLTNSRKGTGGD